MEELHIDIETYSSIDLKTCGAYRYLESLDFEILILAYAFNGDPVKVVDVCSGEAIPIEFIKALKDPSVRKCAHNAVFERIAFLNYGYPTKIEEWYCSAIQAAYCGLPLSLWMVGDALGFGEEKGKLATGKALIRYFSMPCKPTKTNGGRTRNFPEHDPEKWGQYKEYCARDVEVERSIGEVLQDYKIPETERRLYALDQQINDRGILIDTDLARGAYRTNAAYVKTVEKEMIALAGVGNPHSVAQLKEWMGAVTGKTINSLAKAEISNMLEDETNEDVREVLRLRQRLSKSSIKKYTAMLNCICSDSRGHGFFQFYGANRTGRWAGRLVQLQNLTKNYISDLEVARQNVKSGDYRNVELLYSDVTDILSQLIRTTFVAPKGSTFAIADFSAIEARVTAWLAGENWRLDVFNTHGRIYEASASSMFGVPIEEVTKGSELRQKGKVAELALGYQGSVGALKTMGAEAMGLSESEMEDIVTLWRQASPSIVSLWKELEACAKKAVKTKKPVRSKNRGLLFECDADFLTILLPSGRKLFYREPKIRPKTVRKANGETWEAESLTYMGMDQVKKQWTTLDTYGGKLTENVVQAIARDVLADSMLRLDKQGFEIVMHVHDEVVCEIRTDHSEWVLKKMCDIMSAPIEWAHGLPLAADGYLSEFYKKD